MLSTPIYVLHVPSNREGLAVSETILTTLDHDGAQFPVVHWCVLFLDDEESNTLSRTPEYIPVNELEWKSVPGILEEVDDDEEEFEEESEETEEVEELDAQDS